MSAIVECKKCGQLMEVPAYEGDGVYSEHHCPQQSEERHTPREYQEDTDLVEEQ